MERNSDKIQRYIKGMLFGDELLQFEAEMAVDDELRNLINLQREVYDILNNRMLTTEMESRRSISSNIYTNSDQSRQLEMYSMRFRAVVLTGGILLLSLFFYILYNILNIVL